MSLFMLELQWNEKSDQDPEDLRGVGGGRVGPQSSLTADQDSQRVEDGAAPALISIKWKSPCLKRKTCRKCWEEKFNLMQYHPSIKAHQRAPGL